MKDAIFTLINNLMWPPSAKYENLLLCDDDDDRNPLNNVYKPLRNKQVVRVPLAKLRISFVPFQKGAHQEQHSYVHSTTTKLLIVFIPC